MLLAGVPGPHELVNEYSGPRKSRTGPHEEQSMCIKVCHAHFVVYEVKDENVDMSTYRLPASMLSQIFCVISMGMTL